MNQSEKSSVRAGLVSLAALGTIAVVGYSDYRTRNAAADLMVNQFRQAQAVQQKRGLSQGDLFQASDPKGSVAVVRVENLYDGCANLEGRLYTNTLLSGATVQLVRENICPKDDKVSRLSLGFGS